MIRAWIEILNPVLVLWAAHQAIITEVLLFLSLFRLFDLLC